MRLGRSTTTLLASIISAMIIGCSGGDTPQQREQSQQMQRSGGEMQMDVHASHGGGANSVAGIEWSVPEGWVSAGEKPMRVATYFIDPTDGKADCAVFYFGSGQGGDVEANISRWINQVRQPDGSDSGAKAVRGTIESKCCEVATIEVTGTYLFSAGPMMQVQEERPDYLLLGGIVEAPEGNVFFKLAGPSAKAEEFRAAFTSLLKSIRTSDD